MRHNKFWALVVICFIISMILLVVYDVSLVKQGLDKYARTQKEFPIIFLTGIPVAIGFNIYFKLKNRKR